MRKLLKKITAALFMSAWALFCTAKANAAVQVSDFRIGNQSDGVRVVFDMSQSVNYRVFLLDSPQRLVIDLDNTSINNVFTGAKNQIISKTRVGKLDGNNKRVVLELARPVVVKKAFMLQPQSGKPWRFVVDAKLATAQEFKNNIGNKHIVTNDTKFVPQENKNEESWFGFGSQNNNTSGKAAKRKRIIVLDPGHGGKDPGAIGAHGKTFEKNITLAMGKELQEILRRRGYTVYLTRSTDIFIPLRQRIKIAQKYKADLFMSLHADSAQNRSATGLSVYTLSDKASDAEAAALAERENKADIIGGVDLGGNTKEVNDILISLSQTDSRNKSSKYATYLVKEMAKSVKLVKNTHRFAGFAVLKAPDMPSALLEMGYLSNKTEEANLKTPAYRKKLANSAASAIDKYFNDPEIASN
ncbi:MAG: N-acetylmuramoyl-L-alanine amidase [Alphaproteobacteria bacterium]|nr:N-acetylmuramoyl-L-alanine amidase [Alphaproteobacteria bacterium]